MLREMTARRRERYVAWGAIAAILLAVSGARIAFLYEPYTFLIGDCPYYAQAAISLLVDGDLDLRDQLRGGIGLHQRQISLGERGEWYPKHPVLMPVLTLPLLPLLGMDAFLVFNLIVLVVVGVTLYEIARLAARPAAAAAGSLSTIFGSFLILYDYNYSPDLFACLWLALSVLATFHSRPGAAGACSGLAALARTSNLFLLPVLFAYAAWKGRARGAALFAAAALLPLLAQAALNDRMFGSPLVSPYARIMTMEGGRVVLHSHVADFDNSLWDGMIGQIVDREKGLLFTAPILLIALPGFGLWLRRGRDQALLCFVIGEFLFLLFSRYRWWPTSHQGNRFLMPLVALSAPAVACAVEWALLRLRVLKPAPPESVQGGDAGTPMAP